MTEPCAINLPATEIEVGYTGYAKTNGQVGRLIRIGERIKFHEWDYNHVFTVIGTGSTYEDIIVVQATPVHGVIISKLTDITSSASVCDLFRPPSGCDGQKVAQFARAQVGDPYGLLTIACIAIDILTPEWFVSFRRPGSWICSALGGEALRFGGFYADWGDIYTPTPTQLAHAHKQALRLIPA
jgi:hypothetical protein